MNMYSGLLGMVAFTFVATTAQAAPVIYNNTIPAGTAAFDATVAGAGGTVVTDTLSSLSSGTSWARTGYTITSTNGNTRSIDNLYTDNGNSLSGQSIGISPANPAAGSGLTFTFNTGVNAFGLEVGDWATCCTSPLPSSLYISFDGGATRTVASAFSANDNPGYAAGLGFLNFVGAIDTTNTFSTVTFYGDGFGEYLVAGGTIRYAALDIGSVPEVPEPETYAMMLAGLGLIGFSARRRKQA
ncbi:MAG TPA: PEPxxWA-CTERM sorting domain-containing protein [Methylotenera sp.]|nr:PEPxxWA-CTERM sorting domain-containing protein [Methylotenera sp.]HPH04346.1 PEPxxWA-CTERM sorting domain-containing protein [Methylotenera sp.]HPM99900.1 PEPxxWA-CTERM sorting domain-containing protein [Methylotenera sp.]